MRSGTGLGLAITPPDNHAGAGETDPAKLAALAHRKVSASQATLREALHGRVKRQHRFLVRLHLQQIDALDASIAEIDQEVDAGLACFRDAVKQLITIPGVSELSAHVIISEIGTDMSRFATDAHLRSWAATSAKGGWSLPDLACVLWKVRKCANIQCQMGSHWSCN
jgi:hypothetical protein